MLWHAQQKRDKYQPDLPVTFHLADAQRILSDSGEDAFVPADAQKLTSKFQEKLQTFDKAHFDTVVDTFGLCSHEDPVAALKVSLLIAPE